MSSGLEHKIWLPLFGLPLEVHTNSWALTQALDWQQPLGDWARLPTALIEAVPTLQIDVLVGVAGEPLGETRLYRHGGMALAGDGPQLMLAQMDRGYGLAIVPDGAVSTALSTIWELGALLAGGRGRKPIRATAMERDGCAVLLAGADHEALVQACVRRGLRLLAKRVAHVSQGAGGLRIWGDGAGADLLCCAGPAALCLVEYGAGRASQLAPLPATTARGLAAAEAVRVAYRLVAGNDLVMAAALVDHAAGG